MHASQDANLPTTLGGRLYFICSSECVRGPALHGGKIQDSGRYLTWHRRGWIAGRLEFSGLDFRQSSDLITV